MSRKTLILTTSVLITSVLISSMILFLPFLNIRDAIGLNDPRYQSQEVVVNSYNPFFPKISIITKVDDGYLISVEDYYRSGIKTFSPSGSVNGIPRENGFGILDQKVEGKNLNEVKNIAKSFDIQQDTQTINDFDTQLALEMSKPEECRRPIELTESYTENDLSFLEKGIAFNDYRIAKLSGKVLRNESKTYYLTVNIKPNQKNVIKYNIYFSTNNPSLNETEAVTHITKVYNDCTMEEIPLS